MYGDYTRPIAGMHKGTAYKESYTPSSDIKEMYKTRRVYGVMAGFDEPQKVITGLQLLQQGIIDTQTLQENLDGLDNITKIQQRISSDKAEGVLFESLMQKAIEGDPKALMAANEIRKNPQNMTEILDKFFTAEEPEMAPEELAMLQQAQQGGGLGLGGSPVPIDQVLGAMGQQPPVPGGPVGEYR